MTTLTETTSAGAAALLVEALSDRDVTVRAAAASGLRELADLLNTAPQPEAFTARLRAAAAGNADPAARTLAVDLLRSTGLGVPVDFTAALTDRDEAVRLEAVRGLVRCNDADALAVGAGDPSRQVRVTVARGLGTIGDPGTALVLDRLATDPDPLVRAAALHAAAPIGCPPPLAARAVVALADEAWQVREGAAHALGAADPVHAVSPLLTAARDTNLDVRRAAVRSLTRWVDQPGVVAVLRTAQTDTDADVRAYARRALAVVPADRR